MKTLNHFSKEYGQLIKILSLMSIFFIGCTKQEEAPLSINENLNVKSPKHLVIHEGTIQLKGITGFGFYATKGNTVLVGPYDNFLECKAELTFGDDQNFVLHTKEFFPGATDYYREVSFNGKMTPSGQLMFSWPQTFIEMNMLTGEYDEVTDGVLPEMRLHTGCALSGQGINKNTLEYKGYFDGNKFFADMHIVGIQEVAGQLPFLSTFLGCPIMINFLIDLDVSD